MESASGGSTPAVGTGSSAGSPPPSPRSPPSSASLTTNGSAPGSAGSTDAPSIGLSTYAIRRYAGYGARNVIVGGLLLHQVRSATSLTCPPRFGSLVTLCNYTSTVFEGQSPVFLSLRREAQVPSVLTPSSWGAPHSLIAPLWVMKVIILTRVPPLGRSKSTWGHRLHFSLGNCLGSSLGFPWCGYPHYPPRRPACSFSTCRTASILMPKLVSCGFTFSSKPRCGRFGVHRSGLHVVNGRQHHSRCKDNFLACQFQINKHQ
eukprot:jgi/Botrbrau1/22142/Bobra.0206s0066.1